MNGRARKLQVVIVLAGAVEQAALAGRDEYPVIESAIRGARLRDCIALTPLTNPRPAPLQQALEDHQPHIVHFCSHGMRTGGLLLQDDDGQPLPVTAASLAQLFAAYPGMIQGIVFNACHSLALARAVVAHVDWVIAMTGLISDRAAIVFAERLHAALAAGQSVQSAFDRAVAALAVHGTVEQYTPVLLTRNGKDGQPIPASTLFPVHRALHVQTDPQGPNGKLTTKRRTQRGGMSTLSRRRALALGLAVVILAVLRIAVWYLWGSALLENVLASAGQVSVCHISAAQDQHHTSTTLDRHGRHVGGGRGS